MGTMFDFDISMVIVSDSGIGAAIADYGLSLVDLFYANDVGWNVRAMMGYVGGESSPLLAFASLLPPAIVVTAIPLVFARRLEDKDPDRLIATGVFLIACAYVVVMAYNRIQMGGHFLSDVCLGVLLTTCLLRLFFSAFLGPYVTGGESRVSE